MVSFTRMREDLDELTTQVRVRDHYSSDQKVAVTSFKLQMKIKNYDLVNLSLSHIINIKESSWDVISHIDM